MYYYRVSIDCNDNEGDGWYTDFSTQKFDTEQEVNDYIKLCGEQEAESLNFPDENKYEFVQDKNGWGLVRIKEDNIPLTLYRPQKVCEFEDGGYYRGFYIIKLKNKWGVEQFDTQLFNASSFEEAIDIIDRWCAGWIYNKGNRE